MTKEEFWSIVAASKAASGGTYDGRLAALASQLSTLAPEEIVDFQRIFDEAKDDAYTWPLWGAAYILGGGCSDDGFMDFRSWLISTGRETYERALADPESLADVELGPDAEEEVFFEEFAYVADRVYEEKTGEELPRTAGAGRSEPAGEPWEEDDEELERRFPRLWAKYGEA
jgi:hypothetical protein